MKISPIITVLLILNIFSTIVGKAAEIPAFPAQISPAEKAKLEGGELLIYKEVIPGLNWPQLTVFFEIKATPFESVAIYYALDHQKNYIPNLLESTPIKYINAVEIHTAYRMKLPWPMGESRYINGSKLSVPQEGQFRVDWYMVENDQADDVKGYAQFFPADSSQMVTIVKYVTLVKPKTLFAGLLKGIMERDVKKSLEIIKEETLKRKKDANDPIMAKAKQFILDSLAGKFYYSGISPELHQAQKK